MTTMTVSSERGTIPQATVGDTMSFLANVVVPTAGKGILIRRPTVVGISEALDLDRRAVRTMQRLRNKYGRGPLMLRVPGRRQAVILAPEDVRKVLEATPEPFSPASM
jgi:hypothetical protein